MNLTACTRTCLATIALAALAACNPDARDEPAIDGDLLQYVADDTPYFFGALAPAPEDVREKLEPRMDRVLAAYRGLLRNAMREGLEKEGVQEGSNAETTERVIAALDEFVSLLSVEEMRNAGIGADATLALYGVGVLPVLRISLEDEARFEAKIAAIEARAGASMQVAELDGQEYRIAGDEEAAIIVATRDNYAVLSFLPAGLSDDTLRAVLGMDLPTASLASSGRLQALADKYDYTPYGAGYIDFEQLVGTILEEQQGPNAEVLSLVEFDSSQFSDVCKAEFAEIAGIMPRLVSGYTALTAEEMSSNTVLEMRPDIAAGLKTLTAPVPGLGTDHGGMLSLGASIDLQAARDFYAARLDAMEADPYECEHLAQSSAAVAQGRAALEQPLPPMVYGIKGFLAVIEDIEGLDVAKKQPPTSILMQFLLSSDNAPGLVAMGSMFSPELALLNLQPDGKPVRFESPQLQPPIEDVHVAMTNSAVALAVGEGTEGKLTGMLEADPGTPQPFFSMHMDAGRYYSFIGEATLLEREGEDVSPEISAQVNELMQALAGLIDRISLDVHFTDRGIEFPTVTTLAE